MTPLILPTMSIAAEKTFMLLPLVKLKGLVVIPTGSIMIKCSISFYWILLKEANLYQLCSDRVLDALRQVSRSSDFWLWRSRFYHNNMDVTAILVM